MLALCFLLGFQACKPEKPALLRVRYAIFVSVSAAALLSAAAACASLSKNCQGTMVRLMTSSSRAPAPAKPPSEAQQ